MHISVLIRNAKFVVMFTNGDCIYKQSYALGSMFNLIMSSLIETKIMMDPDKTHKI